MLVSILAVCLIIVFVLSVRQEKRRFSNLVLLLVAAGVSGCAVGQIEDNGGLYTHLVSYIFLLFICGCILIALTAAIACAHYRRVGKRCHALYCLAASGFALVLIPYFYCTVEGVLFRGIIDSILHLILFIAIYLVFAFLGLVLYTFLSHLLPTRMKWDYLLLLDLPATKTGAYMNLKLRRRLDDALALYRRLDNKSRIILANTSASEDAAVYLREYGIAEDKIRILAIETHDCKRKLASLADAPANIKPYHAGLILADDYLACRTQHELTRLGLHGVVIGSPTSLIRWAVKILGEYQAMIHLHRIGIIAALICWLILAIVSLLW